LSTGNLAPNCYDCGVPTRGIILVCQPCADKRLERDGVHFLERLSSQVERENPGVDLHLKKVDGRAAKPPKPLKWETEEL
jgi:hypothetical protein